MTAHTQRKHAKLSPSASDRWMSCPGSIKKSEGIENKSSRFADEGTAAHELAQHCFLSGIDPARFIGWYINIDGVDFKTKFFGALPKNADPDRYFEVTEEMADSVQTYLDFIVPLSEREGVQFAAEQRVDLTHIPGMGGGIADFYAYSFEDQVLDVTDFKYGRGVPVDPDTNPQLLSYTSGVIRRFHNQGISKVRLTVVQPRCPHPKGPVRTWEADVVDLLDFEADITEAAKQALSANPPLKAGHWCKFCPAAATCETLRAHALAAAKAEFSPSGEMELPIVSDMKPAEVAEVLKLATEIEDWVRRVQEHAHHEATHGRTPPGFKLVAKRAYRRWKNEADALEILTTMHGLDEKDVLTEPELKTPAQLESLMPGKNKKERGAALAELVSKESSGTVLVPEDDSREAVRADGSEFA